MDQQQQQHPQMMDTSGASPGLPGQPQPFSPGSPMEMKPDVSGPHNGIASPQQQLGGQQPPRPGSPSANYPPLSGSKHFCSICGDRASGKHYGVYSCEGCKGFFKRTVRKELTYACRENRDCVIDKRQRNRCQYCRYMKCLATGMRREAVQEERHRSQSGRDSRDGKNENEVESSSTAGGAAQGDMPIERILEAENLGESGRGASGGGSSGTASGGGATAGSTDDLRTHRGLANDVAGNHVTKQKLLSQLVSWAKRIPHFDELKRDDQVTLLRGGWNELLIAGFAFRSTGLQQDGILWADGAVITRENAHLCGVGDIFDRVQVELVGKMKEMKMDKAELGCLRAIVLFNPDAKGMEDPPAVQLIESLREKVYATLEEYCRTNHENEPSRFAKLLLRLPALRSIGLKCMEHLFFYKILKEDMGLMGEDHASRLEVFIREALDE